MTELQRYNFQLIHKPGSSQKKVDTLSHRLDHTQGKNDNKDQILVKGEWFRNIVTQEDKFWKEVEEAEEFIEEEIREAVEHEEEGQRRHITNFIWPYLHQFFIDSHDLNGYGKPLKRPFDRYQSRLEEINNGQDIRQINW